MDLNTITEILRPARRADLGPWRAGDAFLAGGTWLYSEPQRHLGRLIDLDALGWPALEVSEAGLRIGATCKVAALHAFEPPADWRAGGLLAECCRSFLASFKIWNMASVGGNLCASLPAGPMVSLCVALEGSYLIWSPDGSERRVAAADFTRGPFDTALEPGEILRAIDLPLEALRRRHAFRRQSLTPLGRSGVLLIGTLPAEGGFALTITAATRRPAVLRFETMPGAGALADRIGAEVPDDLWYDDVHGLPDWRAHMTREFAGEIRAELAGLRP
ncbi:FAD binding domain-containing protein [Amaricoccus solimangrovi]|uniref:FAD-binding molybdopterin dehydrogenase n=1 Tax=Amaricoccus solimangrovi TaxID=2589815 RepID=A0A501WSQ9_9RHOB|nr:FAD binding domain-containing protein [Amaricoccus solimangrovi]TPE51395.1 FAD-binding molybdopterin dehydrogenase [Amaricoccus solimangrovi]